jgi:hypothetical protein
VDATRAGRLSDLRHLIARGPSKVKKRKETLIVSRLTDNYTNSSIADFISKRKGLRLLPMNIQAKRLRIWMIFAAIAVVLLLFLLVPRFEGEEPIIKLPLTSDYIGQSQEFTIDIQDRKSGLRKLWVGLLQDGKETVLLEQRYTSGGIFRGAKIHEESVSVAFEPEALGLREGSMVLRIAVWDRSWRDMGNGNHGYLEKELIIDTRPPEIEVWSKAHYLTPGGAGLVIFRTSEDCPQSEVVIGNNTFPSHSGVFRDALVRLAFIGLQHQQNPQTEVFIQARDKAGNQRRVGLNHHIRKKQLKKDVINISDGFLSRKLPEFAADISDPQLV